MVPMSSVFIFLLVPVFGMFAVGFLIMRRGFELKQLAADGVESTATVIRKRRAGSARPRFFVRYEYRDADGNVHTHRSNVTRETWEAVAEGDTIAIAYSASKPRISAPLEIVHQARSAAAR